MGRSTRFAPCALAEIGRCVAPCDGRVGPERYGELVRSLISSLSLPGGLLAALEARMLALSTGERFEEAALARERLRALAEGLSRARTDAWLVAADRLALRDADGGQVHLRGGALVRAEPAEPIPLPCPRERADEVAAVRSWLGRNRTRLLLAEPPLAEPVDGGAELHRLLSALRRVDRGTSERGPFGLGAADPNP
jgi:DNA polymerase-3 subunit epsilon